MVKEINPCDRKSPPHKGSGHQGQLQWSPQASRGTSLSSTSSAPSTPINSTGRPSSTNESPTQRNLRDMIYKLEQARLEWTREKKREATLFRQKENVKKWHASAVSKVKDHQRSIQGLEQVVTLLKKQDALESPALGMTDPPCSVTGSTITTVTGGSYAANFTPPHSATGATVTTQADVPTIPRVVVNPYATPPRNLAIDLTLANEADVPTIPRVVVNPYATPPRNLAVDHTLANEEYLKAKLGLEEGVAEIATLKTTGETDDDYANPKSGGSFPPNHGDDDDKVVV